MEQKNRERSEESGGFDVGFTVPKVKSITERLDAALREKEELRKQHEAENEKEKQGKGQGNKKKQKRGGSICCCEDPNCRIGPFIEREGKDE